MAYQIPFEERKTPWRGILDLATGCYPRFLFGGSPGRALPVFHFHEVTPKHLENCLMYLAENGYHTVTSKAIAALALRGTHPGPRSVALTFDDAWLSLWTVAFPLLRKYGFTAISYVSPGRIPEADRTRPAMLDDGWQPSPKKEYLFSSWPELKAMHDSGAVDIQAHSFSHSSIFCDDTITGFVTPDYFPHIHLRPLLNDTDNYRYASGNDLGCPLYLQRSRMSDATRYFEPACARTRCMELVNREGGAAFFSRPGWEDLLRKTAGQETGRFETRDEQQKAIKEELVKARETLSKRLGSNEIRHICFPFAVSGMIADSLLKETGYETAFADRLWGRRAVYAGRNPYRLMRLKNQFIFCLPGMGRQSFLAAWKNSKK